MASVALRSVPAKRASPGAPASPGVSTGQFPGVPVDLDRLRRVLPDRWSAFLRAHFRDRIHVAFIFGVDERTARNWWDGVGSPRAEVVLLTISQCPDALPYLMEAA